MLRSVIKALIVRRLSAMAAARSKIYVFILLLDSRKFETVGRVNQDTRTFQSGDPILWLGKDAVVLGTGCKSSFENHSRKVLELD